MVLRVLVAAFALLAAGDIEQRGSAADRAVAPDEVAAVDSSAEPEVGAQVKETVETILSNPLPNASYVQVDECVNKRDFRKIEILDETSVLLTGGMSGKHVWFSRLLRRCRGLKHGQMIQLANFKPTVCRGEQFATVMRGHTTDPRDLIYLSEDCWFGAMQRFDPGEFESIRQALVARERTRTLIETEKALE